MSIMEMNDWLFKDVKSQIEQYGDQTIMQYSRECQEVLDGIWEVYNTLIDAYNGELASEKIDSFIQTLPLKKIKLAEWNVSSTPVSNLKQQQSQIAPSSSISQSAESFSFVADSSMAASDITSKNTLNNVTRVPLSIPGTPVTPVARIIPSISSKITPAKKDIRRNLISFSSNIDKKAFAKPAALAASKAAAGNVGSHKPNVAEQLAALKKLSVAERQRLVRERKREEDDRRRALLRQKLSEKDRRLEKSKLNHPAKPPPAAALTSKVLQPSNSILDSLYSKKNDESSSQYAKPYPKTPTSKAPKTPGKHAPFDVVTILNENDELPDIPSESESDNTPVKGSTRQTAARIIKANWTQTPKLLDKLNRQEHVDPDTIFGPMSPVHVDAIFGTKSKTGSDLKSSSRSTHNRSSSGGWSESGDALTVDELITYKKAMKFI